MYGENTGQLRAEFTTLLRQHRIQQRLGGKGIHTVPETTTVAEREELGHQIARFRRTVLVWCFQAVNATSPSTDLEGSSHRTRRPVEELRSRLAVAIEASSSGPTFLDELTTPQRFPIVETCGWPREPRLWENMTSGPASITPSSVTTSAGQSSKMPRKLPARWSP